MKRHFLTGCLLAFVLVFLTGQAHSSATYKVRSGDTLRKISKKYHIPVDKLKSMNNLRTTALKPGQVLIVETETTVAKSRTTRQQKSRIDTGKQTVAAVESVPEENENSEYIEYRVRRGDTLDKLARKFNVDKAELIDLNNIRKKRLAPGSIVFIPKLENDTDDAPIHVMDRPLKQWRNEEERGILVKVAKSFSGAPYRYGGDSVRGLDCSAFVKKMYEIFEVQLPRSAREQFYAGQRVNKEDLTTGDLVFFKTKRYAKHPTHVGIYIGDDKFIHASSLLRRGVKVDSLNDTYFARTYIGAVRVKSPPPMEQTEGSQHPQKVADNT